MRKPGLGIAALLAITIAGPAYAQLPSVQLPPVPTPQLPSVPSLPAPQLPSVPQLPAPQLPSVPSVPTPKLPSVQLPSAPAPSAPAPAPAPSRTAPSAPAGSAGSAPAASAPASSTSSASGRSPATATRAAGGGTPARTPSARTSERVARRSEPARARSELRADRRVRRVVARYTGCLAELSTRQRRVLRLRAGIGPREPATRADVARKLDLPVARVRRAERRGLRALERAARDGCAAAATDGAGVDPELATADPGSEPVDDATAVLASGSGGGTGDAPGGASGDGVDGSSSGRGGTESDSAGGVKGITAVGGPPDPGETGVILPVLGILLLLVCLAGFGLETRRVWRARIDAGPHG